MDDALRKQQEEAARAEVIRKKAQIFQEVEPWVKDTLTKFGKFNRAGMANLVAVEVRPLKRKFGWVVAVNRCPCLEVTITEDKGGAGHFCTGKKESKSIKPEDLEQLLSMIKPYEWENKVLTRSYPSYLGATWTTLALKLAPIALILSILIGLWISDKNLLLIIGLIFFILEPVSVMVGAGIQWLKYSKDDYENPTQKEIKH